MPSHLPPEEIEALRASLDHSERDAQAFLEHVVHDLRSARRAVGISTEVLLAEITHPTEELPQSVRHLQEGLAKMDAILSGVSNYCLSLRPTAYNAEVLPAEMVVRLALTGLQKEVRETGAIITYDRLPQVVGDRDRLTSLFRHLIDNALRYRSAEAPQIEIKAKPGQGYWCFSVQDNGIGIDLKYCDKVFAPFSRLHGSEIPGVGLGLAICKKIVNAHGGTIRVKSIVGRGTTIFFTIPAENVAAVDNGIQRDRGEH